MFEGKIYFDYVGIFCISPPEKRSFLVSLPGRDKPVRITLHEEDMAIIDEIVPLVRYLREDEPALVAELFRKSMPRSFPFTLSDVAVAAELFEVASELNVFLIGVFNGLDFDEVISRMKKALRPETFVRILTARASHELWIAPLS